MWRTGIIRKPLTEVLRSGDVTGAEWLPAEGPLRFVADPFGIWRDGKLHLFVEAYDYRVRVGAIDLFVLDADLRVLSRERVLSEPWHLSYPFVWEAEGEVWMLPEAFRSGRQTLYQAESFPRGWRAVATWELDFPPIDATPVHHQGRWWMFYTPGTTTTEKISHLHVAFADTVRGPWRVHPLNPVRRSLASARPGGTPVVIDGVLTLPMQDCTTTYGGGVRALRILELTPERFEAEAGDLIAAPVSYAPYTAGLHTLSAAGDVTLVDAKWRVPAPLKLASRLRGAFRTR